MLLYLVIHGLLWDSPSEIPMAMGMEDPLSRCETTFLGGPRAIVFILWKPSTMPVADSVSLETPTETVTRIW
jgi:hypothetical protein